MHPADNVRRLARIAEGSYATQKRLEKILGNIHTLPRPLSEATERTYNRLQVLLWRVRARAEARLDRFETARDEYHASIGK